MTINVFYPDYVATLSLDRRSAANWFDIVLLDCYLLLTVGGMELQIRQIQVSSGRQPVMITLLGL